MFYVYKWYIKNTNEVFYIGKGCHNRVRKIRGRNKIFLDYYNNNDCGWEILEYFENEEDAFAKEKELIAYYWSIGEAEANIDEGGHGGHKCAMTLKQRQYRSKYCQWRSPEYKAYISEHNPMKNPETAELVASQNRKPIVIGEKEYSSINEAMKELNVPYETIRGWCKKGYNSDRVLCYYKEDGPINSIPLLKNEQGVLIDGQYFPSIKRAATFLGKKSGSRLAEALRNHKKTYCGHTIEYANQQPSQENNQ